MKIFLNIWLKANINAYQLCKMFTYFGYSRCCAWYTTDIIRHCALLAYSFICYPLPPPQKSISATISDWTGNVLTQQQTFFAGGWEYHPRLIRMHKQKCQENKSLIRLCNCVTFFKPWNPVQLLIYTFLNFKNLGLEAFSGMKTLAIECIGFIVSQIIFLDYSRGVTVLLKIIIYCKENNDL